MAYYDSAEDRIVVTIVYDGVGNAGKSTNVRELCNVFTPMRRSELYVPEARKGRTLYFDWLQVESGLVGGYRLRCQVLSVPGQLVLGHRRAHLLGFADVVVMVCESSPRGVDRVKDGFARTRRFVDARAQRRVPFIVQANKQDQPNALSSAEVARRLGLDHDTPVVSARASESVGVRETAALAIRAAADSIQKVLLTQGLAGISGPSFSPKSLYSAMQSSDDSANTSIEGPLFDDEGLGDPDAFETTTIPPTPMEERVTTPSTPSTIAEPSMEREGVSLAAWPNPSGDSGPFDEAHVWPRAGGVAMVADALSSARRPRADLVGRTGTSNGSGKTGLILFQAGRYCLKTGQSRAYATEGEAVAALQALSRTKELLGDWLPPETALAILYDRGRFWLWTVTYWHQTLRARLDAAEQARDEQEASQVLEEFAHCFARSLRTLAERNILIDLHPSNVAYVDGRSLYLDDDLGTGGAYPLVHAVMQRFEEFSQWPDVTSTFAKSIARAVRQELAPSQLRDLGLGSLFSRYQPRHEAARRHHEALLSQLGAYESEPTAQPSSAPLDEQAAQTASRATRPGPPLPRSVDDLPSGFVWPGGIGRDLLRRLADFEPLLSGSHVANDVTYTADAYVLSTSRTHCFSGADDGRAALLLRARQVVADAGETVLVLVPEPEDGTHWLWSIDKRETST